MRRERLKVKMLLLKCCALHNFQVTEGQNVPYHNSNDWRSKCMWSDCVLIIPFTVNGNPNGCWLHTYHASNLEIRTYCAFLWSPKTTSIPIRVIRVNLLLLESFFEIWISLFHYLVHWFTLILLPYLHVWCLLPHTSITKTLFLPVI